MPQIVNKQNNTKIAETIMNRITEVEISPKMDWSMSEIKNDCRLDRMARIIQRTSFDSQVIDQFSGKCESTRDVLMQKSIALHEK